MTVLGRSLGLRIIFVNKSFKALFRAMSGGLGGNSSIVIFSNKPFEYILSISIIAQAIPQSLTLVAHRSVTHSEKLSCLPAL